MADTNLAVNFDFNALIDAHISSDADVTVAYAQEEIPEGMRTTPTINQDMYYTFTLEDGRVKKIHINSKESGLQNCSMNIYVMDKELLINQIETAFVRGYAYFERDILVSQLGKLNIRAFKYEGYIARISDCLLYTSRCV